MPDSDDTDFADTDFADTDFADTDFAGTDFAGTDFAGTEAAIHCDRCGQRCGPVDHETCAAARSWEPPRYCTRCARRLVVQVTPSGWSARCSEHGNISSDAAGV